MAKRWISVVVFASALLAAGCGGDGPDPPPGVSALSYSPKPFSKDQTTMRVRFTTTGPAGPGREYKAWLFTGKDNRDRRCYSEGESDGIQGEPGRTYEVIIDTGYNPDEAPFCFGNAQLVVWTQDAEGAPPPRHTFRKLSFQILPPR